MKLKEFGFKNICSYGNKLQVIKMPDEPQLILIHGENGGGKTTISTALKFALWGRDTRRGAKDIANWFNGAGYAYANFNKIDGMKVEVHRGSRPDFQELKINDDQSETPASKAALLSRMENELIGINEDVLNNTMILSINDFKSFIKMGAQDKRKIINRLFDAENLDEMHEILKADYKTYEENYTKVLINLQANESMRDRLNNQISVIGDRLATINKDRLRELNESVAAQITSIQQLQTISAQKHAEMVTIETNKNSITLPGLVTEKQSKASPISGELQRLSMEKAKKLGSLVVKATTHKSEKFAVLRQDSHNKLQSFLAAKQDAENEVRTRLNAELNAEKSKIETNINTIRELIAADALNYQTFIDRCNSTIIGLMSDTAMVSNDKAAADANIKILDKKIALYNSGKCPECDTDLTDKEHKHGLEQYSADKDQHVVKIASASKLMADIDISIKHIETQMSDAKVRNQSFTVAKNMEIQDLQKLVPPLQESMNSKYKPQFDAFNRQFESDQKNVNDNLVKDEAGVGEAYDARILEINYELNTEFDGKMNELHRKLEQLDKDYAQLRITTESDCAGKMNEAYQLKARTDAQIAVKTTKLNELNTELANMGNSQVDEIALQEANRSLSEIEAILASLQEEKLKLESQMRILTITKELFGDEGIKRVIFDNVLPTVNGSIEKLVEKLEYKYPFSFDDKFDPKVTYMGMEIDTSAISAGEDKKMDIIVILSMIELIKLKHPDVNFMFLDEIFNSLDVKSIGKVVQILREYMLRFGMSIFVISHTPVPMEYFDKVIEVTFSENFSDLTIK